MKTFHQYSIPPALWRAGLALLTLLALAAGTAPAWANAPQVAITMTVAPTMGGHVKYGEWLPLRIEISNTGEDADAEVRTKVSGNSGDMIFAVPVPLPAGAHKAVVLYTLPPTFSRALSVQLVSGDTILAQDTNVTVTPHYQNEYLVGVLADNPDTLAILSGLTFSGRAQTTVIPMTLADLPERAEPLRSLDCLIISGVDTTALSPAQAAALQLWVETGGRLMVGGGSGAARTLAGLPDALRPASLGDTVDLPALDQLAELAGKAIRVPGPFVAAIPADPAARTILSQDGYPLMVLKTLGSGTAGYVALDLTSSPFDAWAGALSFWQRMLAPGADYPINLPPDIPVRMLESEQMGYALQNIPALNLPSMRWLALLLCGYILLVGPLNYVILRRLRRLAWAWLTIPALTLIFSAMSYGLGYGLRGNDVLVNRISVITLPSNSDHPIARSYVGVFSPTRSNYQVRVGGAALVAPMSLSYTSGWGAAPVAAGPLNVLQGDPSLVRNLSVNQWAMQTFQAETVLDTSAYTLDADLSVNGDQIQGVIRNGMGAPLFDLVLISGNRFALLGDLAAGEQVEVDAPLKASSMGSYFPWSLFEQYTQNTTITPSPEMMLHQSILEAYFHTNWGTPAPPEGMVLLAWSDVNPLETEVIGVRTAPLQTTLVVKPLLPRTVAGRINLPPGSLVGRVAELSGDAGECGYGAVYLNRGYAVLEYQLPSEVQGLEPARLTIDLGKMDPSIQNFPTVQAYDWDAGGWSTLATDLQTGVLAIPDPAPLVDPFNGIIRLKLEKEDNSFGGCFQVNIGLEYDAP